MAESHQKFGDLLTEGIQRVHIVQKKPIGYILDMFGYELREDGVKGRYALGHWYYKKRIPADSADVEKLARLIVLNSDVDRHWLEQFLDSAGYPDPVKICNQYFVVAPEFAPPIQPKPAPVIPAQPVEAAPAPVEIPQAAPLPTRRKPKWAAVLGAGFIIVAGLAGLLSWQLLFPMPVRAIKTPFPVAQITATQAATATLATPTLPISTHTPPPETPIPIILPSPTLLVAPADFDGRCPPLGQAPAFNYSGLSSFLDFLNSGGPLPELQQAFDEWITQNPLLRGAQIAGGDLTGDGIAEISISLPRENGSDWQFLGCHAGKYRLLAEAAYDDLFLLQTIVDMNANRKAEIVRYRQVALQNNASAHLSEFSIQEWDGQQFQELMDTGWYAKIGAVVPVDAGAWGTEIINASAAITDTNHDGLFELAVTGGLSSDLPTCETVYERQFTDLWFWDGEAYLLSERVYTAPIYRFQASADGDVAFAFKQYDRALDLYQRVVFNDELHPRDWFPSQLEYCGRMGSGSSDGDFDPQLETIQLQAYGRWRILLTQVVQNHLDAAQIVYDTLQQKFPAGTEGHSYAVIAASFWETYQTTQNIAVACAQARETAQVVSLYSGHTANTICSWP